MIIKIVLAAGAFVSVLMFAVYLRKRMAMTDDRVITLSKKIDSLDLEIKAIKGRLDFIETKLKEVMSRE